MAFVVSKGPRVFGWPVKLQVTDLEGKAVEQEFIGQFVALDIDRLAENRDVDDPLRLRDLMQEVWVGWTGIVDDAGQEVPFDTARRDEMLRDPAILRAVAEAVGAGAAGRREKN